MPKKRHTAEEIIQHLRTVELDTGKGLAVLDSCRKLGITEQTYYRWNKEYGGLSVDQAKRLKGLEQENLRRTGDTLRRIDPCNCNGIDVPQTVHHHMSDKRGWVVLQVKGVYSASGERSQTRPVRIGETARQPPRVAG